MIVPWSSHTIIHLLGWVSFPHHYGRIFRLKCQVVLQLHHEPCEREVDLSHLISLVSPISSITIEHIWIWSFTATTAETVFLGTTGLWNGNGRFCFHGGFPKTLGDPSPDCVHMGTVHDAVEWWHQNMNLCPHCITAGKKNLIKILMS